MGNPRATNGPESSRRLDQSLEFTCNFIFLEIAARSGVRLNEYVESSSTRLEPPRRGLYYGYAQRAIYAITGRRHTSGSILAWADGITISQECCSTVRGLKNVTVELKNWHPATSGNVDGSNNSNVGAADLAMPNPPTLIGRIQVIFWSSLLSIRETAIKYCLLSTLHTNLHEGRRLPHGQHDVQTSQQ